MAMNGDTLIDEIDRILSIEPWLVKKELRGLREKIAENPKRLPRTLKQNAALHCWCKELATEFNNRGLYVQHVLKPSWEIEWSMELVKDNIVRPIAEQIAKTDKTSQLSSAQLSQVIDIIDKNLLTKFDINLPFTHEQSM